MKLKMFLRGVGAGIVLCAIVLFAAYKTNDTSNMSDADIIKKAEELGMVTTEDELSELIHNSTDGSTEENTEDVSTEATTEENTEDVSTEATTEKNTEEASTESSNKTVKIDITVSSGMTSTAVAKMLQQQGVVEDYNDFDRYLNENGYSYKIPVGTFTVEIGYTYEQIAKAMCP